MRRNTFTLIFLVFLFSSFNAFSQDQYFNSDGVKIRYITKGSGEPVVLIHGMTQNIENCWTIPVEGGNLIERLSKNHLVIALDCRGHGKSDKPHDSAQYGMMMVKDVVNLLEHLNIIKAHFIGFSMGGIIAGNMLAKHPDKVLSAVFCGSLIDSREGNEQTGLQSAMRNTASDILAGRGFYSMIKWLDMPAASKLAITDEQALQAGRFVIKSTDSLAIVSIMKAFVQLDVEEKKTRKNKISTLVIIGTQDRSITIAKEKIQRFKNASLKEIPGADHLGLLRSKEFYDAVETFVNTQKSNAKKTTRLKTTANSSGLASVALDE